MPSDAEDGAPAPRAGARHRKAPRPAGGAGQEGAGPGQAVKADTAPPATGWRAIRDTALARLRSGAWAPGARIPTEAALAAEFGCARATVNRALRDLAQAGYLDRRRRSGTRVVRHPVRKATLAIPVIRLEVEATGRTHAHRLLSRRLARPPAGVARAMGPGAPARLLHLRGLHTADGAPHALEDRWVNAEATPALLEVDLHRISANEWLVEHVPYTRGLLTLSASAATAAEAADLACAPGAAVFTLERVTWRGVEPITWVRVTYPPGHSLTTEL